MSDLSPECASKRTADHSEFVMGWTPPDGIDVPSGGVEHHLREASVSEVCKGIVSNSLYHPFARYMACWFETMGLLIEGRPSRRSVARFQKVEITKAACSQRPALRDRLSL